MSGIGAAGGYQSDGHLERTHQAEEVGEEGAQQVGSTSVNPLLARTRSIFGDLVNQGVLVLNPAALVKPLAVDTEKKMAALTAEQSPNCAATDAHCYGIAWRLAVLGLPRGEILALC